MPNNPDAVRITLLGAGQEVGRSCCVLQRHGKTVVCDAGIHPSYNGMASLPFVDELDWSTVDAILITHFHLDHVGALTFITEKTNFRHGNGKVYMSHPTKALHKLMMQDYLRTSSPVNPLFTQEQLSASLASIRPVAVHERITPYSGVSFISYHAGHVLGARMFLIDIAGCTVLYTGDFSRCLHPSRHLIHASPPPPSSLPTGRPTVLISESTFGTQTLPPAHVQEQRLTAALRTIIARGGHALLPIFAIGVAQALLLVLDEYWDAHPALRGVPLYCASGLAERCTAVYQAYVSTMNEGVRARCARGNNPFVFRHLTSIPWERDWVGKIAEGPPCVVLASPAFMQDGVSRKLLELWAPDPKNGIIITGFSVEGTLARDIQNEPDEIPSLGGTPIPRRLSVDYIPSHAHVGYPQNAEFIELVDAKHVVLVHGERNTMKRLSTALIARYKNRGRDLGIHTPRNLETLELSVPTTTTHIAKVIGTLAAQRPTTGDTLSGLLVSSSTSHTLVDPRDVNADLCRAAGVDAGASVPRLWQRQRLALGMGWDVARGHLEGLFGHPREVLCEGGMQKLQVLGVLDVMHVQERELVLEWESEVRSDMIADAAAALLIGAPLSWERAHPHAELGDDSYTKMQRLACFLEAHFGKANVHIRDEGQDTDITSPVSMLTVLSSRAPAHVDTSSMTVTCVDEPLKKRIEDVLRMAISTVSSLAELFGPDSPMVVREGVIQVKHP